MSLCRALTSCHWRSSGPILNARPKDEICARVSKVLRDVGNQPAGSDIHTATLQFVSKISGYHSPSRANVDPFETAVGEITAASLKMLTELQQWALAGANQE